MSPFKKLILIVLLAGVLLTTVYVYFIFLNTGELRLDAGEGQYTAYLNEIAYPCLDNPCLLKLKSGNYELRIEKPGYYTYAENVNLGRASETELKVELEEIPRLKESGFSKESDSRPSFPTNDDEVLAGIWNEEQSHYLFVDKTDEKLKIRDMEGGARIITTLKNLTPPLTLFWAPNEQTAIIADGRELYFIKTELGARNKFMADFEPVRAMWTPDSVLLNDPEGALYKVSLDDFSAALPSTLKFDLDACRLLEGTKLICYRQSGNTTSVILVDLKDRTEEVLTERLDFPIDDIYYDSALSLAYFRESNSQTWYEIKIQE